MGPIMTLDQFLDWFEADNCQMSPLELKTLQLYLKAAHEYVYARLGPNCLKAWIEKGELPAMAQLFILQYVLYMQDMEGGTKSGVITSERIGGLSQSFGVGSNDGAALSLDDLWDMLIGNFCDENPNYRGKNHVRVFPARKKWRGRW